MFDPFLRAMDENEALPPVQSLANAAIVAVFAYLVPLLTMEINYFRLAVYKSWRRNNRNNDRNTRRRKGQRRALGGDAGAGAGDEREEGGEDEGGAGSAVIDNDGKKEVMDLDRSGEEGNAPTRAATVTTTVMTTTTATTTTTRTAAPAHDDDDDDESLSSSSSSAVAHLLNDVSRASQRTILTSSGGSSPPLLPPLDPSLRKAYASIRLASTQAIAFSLLTYSLTAAGIGSGTRGLDAKVVAIVVGCSQFLAAIVVFIVSAKAPQWIGVYHRGRIRLVKCSSSYSQHFDEIDLDDASELRRLKNNVRLGVWFHFSKFYIVLMPFYCGVRPGTVPLSILAGAVIGFVLMWAVFVVHEKCINHRNTVSFLTIFLLSVISSLTFTRGMAWMQAVWRLNILRDEDTLMVISFFTWLALCAMVHTLFLWHTLRMEESEGVKQCKEEEGAAAVVVEGGNEDGRRAASEKITRPKKVKGTTMRRSSSYDSYSSFIFDPRTHFKDGKCQFSDHPDLEDDFTNELTSEVGLPLNIECDGGGGVDGDQDGEEDFGHSTPITEMPMIENGNVVMEFDDDEIDNTESPNLMEEKDLNPTTQNKGARSSQFGHNLIEVKRLRCACCELFIYFSPEYQQSSCVWKVLIWFKIFVIALAYLFCLYFVIVSIGATQQISSTRNGLPAVQEALYNHMNEGPVCAFDNRGSDSDIITFADKEAAHAAGYLIVHCGACGACSSWENLIIEYTTRDNMAALANECAKKALFGGGDDALAECLMEPEIGFEEQCAICWMEDILCTKDHCVFIFLQSQMTNNVGNFAVGENEITSASCEEAHCEVGQFVPCSGATRRRMNIVSSISRPGDQQCGIVDVESWEDLFFGSGVA